MNLKKIFKNKENFPRIWPVIFLFLLANYLISKKIITIGILIAIIGGFWAFYAFTNSFTLYIKKKKLFLAILYWIAMLFTIALIFSFFQAFAYSKSLGYLKFGECNASENFRALSPQEISNLTGVVPIDTTKYLYYNIITMTTLGYGDICPQGDIFRLISISEVLLGLAINLFFVSIAIQSFLKPNQ